MTATAHYRMLAVTMNAMGMADAVDFFSRKGGDVDFSLCQRLQVDEEDLPAALDAPAGPAEAGGYVVVLVRVALLNASGNEIDADVRVINIDGPGAFFDAPAWTTDDPAYPGMRAAMGRHEQLQALPSGPVCAGPRRL